MEESLFAYTMCQCEQGWLWRLWDETGDVVAAGAAPDQPSAHRRLQEAFERTRAAPITPSRPHMAGRTAAARAAPASGGFRPAAS